MINKIINSPSPSPSTPYPARVAISHAFLDQYAGVGVVDRPPADELEGTGLTEFQKSAYGLWLRPRPLGTWPW
jgi:hypothetical protein